MNKTASLIESAIDRTRSRLEAKYDMTTHTERDHIWEVARHFFNATLSTDLSIEFFYAELAALAKIRYD